MTLSPSDSDLVLRTRRLDLHMVLPAEYELLAIDRADRRLWVDRGFTNPYGHLVVDPGPLPFRIPRVRRTPEAAKYLLRLAVHREQGVVVGSAGFHDLPDDDGMIEIGLGIVPEFRGQGYAQELVMGMWSWVVEEPGVEILRYTVASENAPSQAIIRRFGFHHCGQQIDEIDGPEDIFEMDVDEFRQLYLTGTSRLRAAE